MAIRAVLLALVWLFLAGWTADYALYGVVSVAAATALSLALLPPHGGPEPVHWPRRIRRSVVLAGWFLWQSARGGVDVAVRACRRTPAIEPTVVVAAVELPEGHSRQLAMLMMNLMPGTMVQRDSVQRDTVQRDVPQGDAASQTDSSVELHTLSLELNPVDQWDQLQRRVAAAFA